MKYFTKDLVIRESIAAWLAITALLFAWMGWVEAQPTYQVTQLGNVRPIGINDQGEILSLDPPMLYRGGQWIHLPAGFRPSYLGQDGIVVGTQEAGGVARAAKWRDGAVIMMAPLTGEVRSGAVWRSTDGWTWGNSWVVDGGPERAVPWRWKGSQVLRLQVHGNSCVVASATASPDGPIGVGQCVDDNNRQYVVYWLPNLLGYPVREYAPHQQVIIEAMNNDYLACGSLYDFGWHATCWDPYGQQYDLPVPVVTGFNAVHAVADPQGAKARLFGEYASDFAVAWHPETDRQEMTPLTPDWALQYPQSVNAQGQVVGYNRDASRFYGWLLTPVELVAGQ